MIKLRLLEAVSKEYYEKNYGISEEVFDSILSIDPTSDKKYGRFLMEKFIKLSQEERYNFLHRQIISQVKSPLPEDGGSDILVSVTSIEFWLQQYSDPAIQKYLPPDKKDILKFKDFTDFVYFCYSSLNKVVEQVQKKEAYKQSNIIYEDASIVFLSPKTHKSACYFGSETNWCTSREESSNYYNQYTNAGTLYILKTKDNNGEFVSEEGIQLFIPKEGEEVLAECRDAEDKTIYADKLFSLLPSDNKVVQYLIKKWDSLPNTDQWDEGTGYLDPEVLSPDAEYEDEEEEDETEEVQTVMMENRYEVNNDRSIVSHVSISVFTEIRDSDGDTLETTDPETTFIRAQAGELLTGEEFLKTSVGKTFLKVFLEEEPWKNDENDNFGSIPSFFEKTLVVNYEEHSFSEVKDKTERNYTFDDSNDDFDLRIAKFESKNMDGVHAVIIIASEEATMGDEPIYDNVMYEFDNPVVEKMKKLRNDPSLYGIPKNFFEMEFETEEGSRFATVAYFSDVSAISSLLIDHPIIKKLMSGEFIRDDEEEAKQGQQFLNYEKAKAEKEKALMERKKKKIKKAGRPRIPGKIMLRQVSEIDEVKEKDEE